MIYGTNARRKNICQLSERANPFVLSYRASFQLLWVGFMLTLGITFKIVLLFLFVLNIYKCFSTFYT